MAHFRIVIKNLHFFRLFFFSCLFCSNVEIRIVIHSKQPIDVEFHCDFILLYFENQLKFDLLLMLIECLLTDNRLPPLIEFTFHFGPVRIGLKLNPRK